MATLIFSDGEQFDTYGQLRKELRSDGWYVLGRGILAPMDTEEEADDFLSKHQQP